jgi:hypothetical protein
MSFDIAPIQLPIVPLSWFCAQLLRRTIAARKHAALHGPVQCRTGGRSRDSRVMKSVLPLPQGAISSGHIGNRYFVAPARLYS